jgi:hypothetical protein
MLFMGLVVLSDGNFSDESLARLSKVMSLAQDLRCAIAEGCQKLVRWSCEVPQPGLSCAASEACHSPGFAFGNKGV